jgi:hypothetical protein
MRQQPFLFTKMTKAEFINRVLLIMNEAGLYDNQGAQFIGADSAQVDRYIEGSYVDAWRRCAQVMPKAWFKNSTFKYHPTHSDLADGTGFVVLPSDFYLMNTFKMTGWRKSALDAYIDNEKVESIQSNEYTRGSQIRPVVVIKTKEVDSKEFNYLSFSYFQNNNPTTPVAEQFWYKPSESKIYVYRNSAWSEAVWGDSVVVLYMTFAGIFYVGHPDENNKITEITEIAPFNFGISQVLYYYSLQKGLQSHTVEEAIYVPVASPLSEYDDDSDLELDHRLVEPMAYLSASSVFTIFEKPAIAQALEQKVVEMFPAFKSVKGTNVTFKQ